jgi:hypothetical protein
MPVGDTQNAFKEAAGSDGITLVDQRVGWLNQRGHFGLPSDADRRATVELLQEIYLALGGDPTTLQRGRTTPLTGDFIHPDTGTLIEVDEAQHFTSFRRTTLEMYPTGQPLGFDRQHYVDLCQQWSEKADRYRRAKEARGFGVAGRQRQRAYNDTLRQLPRLPETNRRLPASPRAAVHHRLPPP